MNYSILKFPTASDSRGNLMYINNNQQIPFKIKRIFIVDNVPMGELRGGHAHYKLQEVLIPLQGSFTIEITDTVATAEITLSNPREGILVPPHYWRVVKNFTKNAQMLSLCSEPFSELDYIRNWDNYIKHEY